LGERKIVLLKSMKKVLFLEYKFRDFSDEEIKLSGAHSVMAAFEKLNEDRMKQIKRLGFEFGVSFVSTPGGNTCPLSPFAKKFCEQKLERILKLNPEIIWFDYLMFPGKWTVQKQGTWKQGIHDECRYCKGKDRRQEIFRLAQRYFEAIPDSIERGFFSMPFEIGRFNRWDKKLGQDVRLLGSVFDYISPMLYHRMIDKPVSYIHKHVNYLSKLRLEAKILPIIQLKDMPDDIPDSLSIKEINTEIHEAIKIPSSGVAIFSWDQAIEKNKLEGVSKIIRSI